MKVTYIFFFSYFLCLKFKCYGQTVCSRYLQANFKVFTHIVVNTLRTGLLNCLNARSRGLIQSEVRFL